MSELHIPPFSGGTPDESKGGNHQGLRSTPTPTAGGRDSTLGRTGPIAIVGGRGAKKVAARDEGTTSSRALSRSYFVPRTLEGYERHLRQIECEGYLQRRSRTSGTWRRRWFLLKDGHLSYFKDEEEAEVYRSEEDACFHHHPSSQRQLSLGCVEAVRTEEKIGPLVFRVISSDRDDLVLQAESKEGMNDWLFGFHRSLASIIARVMETGSWPVEQAPPRLLRGVSNFQGTGEEGPPKVLGHGHGRARVLSLRHHRPLRRNAFVEASNRPGHRQGMSWANGDRLKGFDVFASTSGYEGTGNDIAPDCDDNGDDASSQWRPNSRGSEYPPRFAPSPSEARQGRSLSSYERRGRTESMGSWGMARCVSANSEEGFGFGGESHPSGEFSPRNQESSRSGGIAAQGYSTPSGFPASEEAGGAENEGAGGAVGGQGLLSRALPARRQAAVAAGSLDDYSLMEQLDPAFCERKLVASDMNQTQEEKLIAMSATMLSAAMIYGSSDDQDRSSESGHGSTSDDYEESMTSLDAKVVSLELGMEMESHSLLAVVAGDRDRDKKSTYVSPSNKPAKNIGGLGGGGGGKYIPPALRAAAKSEAPVSSTKAAGAGKYVPPAMRAAARADAAMNNAGDAFCGPSGRLNSPGPPSLRNDKGHGGGSVPLPPFGGAGGGAACSALPRGSAFPWTPAKKEHYYTGQYHAQQPCSPSGPCSVSCSTRRGGTGGGPAPTKTPVAPSSGHHDGFRTVESSGDGFCENFAMDEDGEGVGVDLVSERQGFEARGLWWSCGAWSIMGRREKQEDRFCAMPDYTKSIDDSPLFRDMRSSTSIAVNKASPLSGSFAAPTVASSLSSPGKPDVGSAGNGAGANAGLAQGFFGVYDGHCGSEAVQFVRDRLHSTVCEHALFWKEPERAIREAFMLVDEEFLNLAGEKDWYSGTTALVALMRGRKLLVGNLGDGEAVLCRRDQAVRMSPVHNPSRPDENQRIQDANGWVTTEKELFVRQLKQMDLDDPVIRMAATEQVKWNTITRVCGELAVSRSIGDRDFKGFTKRRLKTGVEGVVPQEAALFSWPKGHSGEFRDDLVTADPEFIETEVEEGDQFLLMACDGLWDVLGKPEAVERAKAMFAEGLCAQAVAERMCELAYRMGTSDNVTAVVVQFHHDLPY